MPRREIPKCVLEAALESNPMITLVGLAIVCQCSATSVARNLARHSLRTKRWSERRHSDETKQKMRDSVPDRSGARNPNFGVKDRPWLEGDKNALRQWHKANPDFGERQKGENNPVHKVKHLYNDASYVLRITSGIRAHAKAKAGHTYEETYGGAKAEEYKEQLRRASPARMAKFKRKVTAPEAAVAVMLQSLGVCYVEQAPLGYYTVDFLVPNVKLVIQADGDFWHGHPDKYTVESLTPTQKKQKRLDSSTNSYLVSRDYRVLRLWESDIKDKAAECLARIKQYLEVTNGE